MIFVNHARFVEDDDKVASVTPKHRAYAETLRTTDRLLLGGPLADGRGAMFLYDVPDYQAAQSLIADDPFHLEGVYASTEVWEWDVARVNRKLLDALALRLGQ